LYVRSRYDVAEYFVLSSTFSVIGAGAVGSSSVLTKSATKGWRSAASAVIRRAGLNWR
jgi:hypothetical protein